MSMYFRETPTGEIVESPYLLVRDLAEVPASVWSFACCACIEEGGLCAECRASAAAAAERPRRRFRLFRRRSRQCPA
jgi:hypothetical protein